jgi:hypothetical protein
MTFKQTFCVSKHLISKFFFFFRPGGPTVKNPARGGLSPHGPARLARRSTGPQAITKNKLEFFTTNCFSPVQFQIRPSEILFTVNRPAGHH